MSESQSVLLRVAGASPDVDAYLREGVVAATGLSVHYAPISDTNRGFDLQTMGVAVESLSAAIATVALYFQLRDRNHDRSHDDLIKEAVPAVAQAVENAAESIEAVKALGQANLREPGFLSLTFDTAACSIEVEASEGIIMISVRSH